MLFNVEAFIFGFAQSFVIGPLTILAIHEGLNPKRGIRYELQVVLAGTMVDTMYLLLSLHGIAYFINDIKIQAVMWTCAAAILSVMGLSAFTGKKKKKIYHKAYKHHLHVAQNSFAEGFVVGIMNPISVVSWIMVAGSMYSQYINQISPTLFTANIIGGGIIGSSIIVATTYFFRSHFRRKTLQRLVLLGSVLLVAYGIMFSFKALTEWQTVMASVL